MEEPEAEALREVDDLVGEVPQAPHVRLVREPAILLESGHRNQLGWNISSLWMFASSYASVLQESPEPVGILTKATKVKARAVAPRKTLEPSITAERTLRTFVGGMSKFLGPAGETAYFPEQIQRPKIIFFFKHVTIKKEL